MDGAYIGKLPDAEAHLALARFNTRRLLPSLRAENWRDDLAEEHWMQMQEVAFVESERARIAAAAVQAPNEPDAFIAWFERLREIGPGQGDTLFPWLATSATRKQMRWFITQEVAGEAGFEDLVAMTQVRLPAQAKLELARNYWDEMGRGNEKGMHGPMLTRLAQALDAKPSVEEVVWESLALANLMLALASNRRYAYHAVGALGAIEMTSPTRVCFVDAGLKRLGFPAKTRQYFTLHAALDVRHSAAWNREVLRSLLTEEPSLAGAIAEGALLRLTAGARCFERYRREFGLG